MRPNWNRAAGRDTTKNRIRFDCNVTPRGAHMGYNTELKTNLAMKLSQVFDIMLDLCAAIVVCTIFQLHS